MPKHTGDPLYAMYVQATRKKNGGQTERSQWMVFPPLSKELAKKVDMDPSQDALVFTRYQPALERRVKWKHYTMPYGLVERDVAEKIANLVELNKNLKAEWQWQISAPIVAQISLDELATLIKKPETPWFALKRFEKVAKRLHGLSI